MVLTIDNSDPTNAVNIKKQKKSQEWEVDVKILAMMQRYNRYSYMKGAEPLNHMVTVYAFNRKRPGKYWVEEYVRSVFLFSFILQRFLLLGKMCIFIR